MRLRRRRQVGIGGFPGERLAQALVQTVERPEVATVALLDTGPFYLGVHYLRRYLHLEAGETAVPGGTTEAS